MSHDPNSFGQSPNPFGAEPAAFSNASVPSDSTAPNRLRGATKTIAILLMVVGIFGLLSLVTQIGMGLLMGAMASADPNNAQFKQQFEMFKASMSSWGLLFALGALLINIALIIGGIGTLRRKRGLAGLLAKAAGLSALFIILRTAWLTYFQWSQRDALLSDMKAQMNANPNIDAEGMASFMEGMIMVGLVLGIIIALIQFALYAYSYFHMSRRETLDQMQ
ncbi:MAG: hypothetical protein ACK5OB_19205 [Pirellula sp.]|jgi:hypothetical protein